MLALSLVITLLNQMVSSFMSFRGANLRWGIQTMLETLGMTDAEKIANELLTSRIVSDSILAKYEFKWLKDDGYLKSLIQRWRLASAIGPDTLVRILTNMSESNSANAGAIKQLLDQIDPAARRKLGMAYAAFGTPPADEPASPLRYAYVSPPDGTATTPSYQVQIDDLLSQLGNSAQQSVGKIEAWFNVAMNRVSQRFTMQIRIWTVVFSFLLAFGLHLDTFDLFNQLIANPTTVENLVKQSGAMLKEAEAVMGNQPTAGTDGTAAAISSKVLTEQMTALLKEVKPDETTLPSVTVPPSGFHTMAEAEKWLGDNLKPDLKPGRKEDLIGKYKGMVFTGLGKEIGNINKMLNETGIQLVRSPEKINSVGAWASFVVTYNEKRDFLGVLLTAGLLALGAPFWYNALKNLVNLRPMVAQRQDQQKKDAAAA
jgi:hypothetical protein